MERHGTLNYDNGVYEGELAPAPHGVGKMTYADGSVSTGIWKNGQIVYEGELLNGKPHGRGKKVYSNGDVYEGDWKNGVRDGEGTLNFENGDVYTGEWRANKMQGKGTLKFHNGDVYSGEFSDNKKHGGGTYEYAKGETLKSVGTWKEGNKCGLFEDIVRKQVYNDNGEVKSNSNVEREASRDENNDTDDSISKESGTLTSGDLKDADAAEKLTVKKLREQCKERGLKVGGTKAEIIQRMKDYDDAAATTAAHPVEEPTAALLDPPQNREGEAGQRRSKRTNAGQKRPFDDV